MNVEWVWADAHAVLRDRMTKERFGIVMWVDDCAQPWLACRDRGQGGTINKSFMTMVEAEEYVLY